MVLHLLTFENPIEGVSNLAASRPIILKTEKKEKKK